MFNNDRRRDTHITIRFKEVIKSEEEFQKLFEDNNLPYQHEEKQLYQYLYNVCSEAVLTYLTKEKNLYNLWFQYYLLLPKYAKDKELYQNLQNEILETTVKNETNLYDTNSTQYLTDKEIESNYLSGRQTNTTIQKTAIIDRIPQIEYFNNLKNPFETLMTNYLKRILLPHQPQLEYKNLKGDFDIIKRNKGD